MSRWVIGLSLLGATCGSCSPPRAHLVPMVLRPDTRRLAVIHVDSVALRETFAHFNATFPNEGAVCYTGRLYDSTATYSDGIERPIKVLNLTHAEPSRADSVDRFNVYGVRCSRDAIAAGHSHPYSQDCRHSDEDALLLFNTQRYLVSFVWCGNGEVENFFQDGRRGLGRWRKP